MNLGALKINNQKLLLLALMLGLGGLLVVRDVLGVGITKYLFLVYAVGLMFFANYEKMN